jgi:hypothetical protein
MTSRLVIIFFLITCACVKLQAQVTDIITIAGCDSVGAYGGDGGPAINAKLWNPQGITLDKQGNIYFADLVNCRIRKIKLSTGIITTVAGNDTFGYGGDGDQATNATLYYPEDVFIDSIGNIFFADGLNNRVRKVTVSTGIITTVAGNGIGGDSGDGGPATNAELNLPVGICLDNNGNIYIADGWNYKVRKVDAATGIITTIAGNGVMGNSGFGGPATNAELDGPSGIFLGSNGDIFVADQFNNSIHRVDVVTGIITTIAGTGTTGYSGDGGLAVNAELNQPICGYIDKLNNIYFTDGNGATIRRIDGNTGIITTVAGNGTLSFSGDGRAATVAGINAAGVVLDSNGIMYIADYGNMRIRMVYNTLSVPLTPEMKYLVYPNPANEELKIDGLTENTQYRLLSVTGSCLRQGVLEPGSNTLPIKNFVSGIYILELTDIKGQRNMIRIIKE